MLSRLHQGGDRRNTNPAQPPLGGNPVQGNVAPPQNPVPVQGAQNVPVQNVPVQNLPGGIQIIVQQPATLPPQEERSILIYHIDNTAPAPLLPPREQGRMLGDPKRVHDYGELENMLAVFIPDAHRIDQDSAGMNKAQAAAAAACRVLNNCNTNKDALFALFHERVGRNDQQKAAVLRQKLRAQITTALHSALELLEQGQTRILTPWSISQMLTGIRGLMDCSPFEGTADADQFRTDAAKLAAQLTKLLGDATTFKPPAQHPWKGKGFSQVLVGLKAIYREGLAPLPDPAHLFGAMKESLSAEILVGWGGWAFANSLDVFATLLPQPPADFSGEAALEVLSLLVGRMTDALSSPHNTFAPLDCLQALTALLKLQDAGVKFGKMLEPAVRALVNRIVELGSSNAWNRHLVKETCNVLLAIVDLGLLPADDPVLDMASWTLIPLGALHGYASSACKLRNAIDYPRPARPAPVAEEAAQPDQPVAREKPAAKPKPQPAKKAQKLAQAPVQTPQEVLADLRRLNSTDLCNRLTQEGAKEAITQAGDAELIGWMKRIADGPPKAKARLKALAVLKTEFQRRISAEQDLGSLLDLVEALPSLGHRGLAGDVLKLLAARISAQEGSLQDERFDFLRLGALMGTLEELDLPPAIADAFLKALAQRVREGKLWNADRAQAAWEVLSCGLECKGVSDLFNALEWTQKHGDLQGAKARNAAVYNQYSTTWVGKAMRDGSECIQITIPLGATQNIITPFMCGCLDANEPSIIIIDADNKGRSNAASGGIAWILSQLDTLSSAPDIAARVKAFGKIVNELQSMVNPQLGSTFVDPRLKGDVRLHLLAPMFRVLDALRWRSSPEQSVGDFLALLSKLPELVEPFCKLLGKALDAYRGRDDTPIDNAKWFVEWMHQFGGTGGIDEAVEQLHNSIYRARNALPPVEETADNEVPFIEVGAGTRGKVQPQPKAVASRADPLAPLTVTILASGQVATTLIVLPQVDSNGLQAYCQNYLQAHAAPVGARVKALRELVTGLLPLLYDNARRSVAVEVLLSLQPAINQVFLQFNAELARHFNAQDLCAILAAIQPKLSQGLGMTWVTVFPGVLMNARSWRLSQPQCDLLIGISQATLSNADHENVVAVTKARTIHSGFPPNASQAAMMNYCTSYMRRHGGVTAASGARSMNELIRGLLALASGGGQRAVVAVQTLLALEAASRPLRAELVFLMAVQFSAEELCALATAIAPMLRRGHGRMFLEMIFEALEHPHSAGITLTDAQCILIERVANEMLYPPQVAELMQIVHQHRH